MVAYFIRKLESEGTFNYAFFSFRLDTSDSMAGSQGVSTLCENTNEVFLDVAKLLITYADNIIR